MRARAGDLSPRTQPSIAISADGRRWSLLNAAPDIRDQLARFPGLHPRPDTRDVPLDSILLTNAELDHVLGLLVLREALPYRIVSTPWVRDAILDHNAAWRLLEPAWGIHKLDTPVALDRDGHLEARLFPATGKVPTYLKPLVNSHPEMCVGVRVTDTRTGKRLVYAPGIRSARDGAWVEIDAADCAFVDGTFFTSDELAALRPGAPDAKAMGHLPIEGVGGSLDQLKGHPGRCLYIHMNNTNPILDPASPQRQRLERFGIEVADDGMEFEL